MADQALSSRENYQQAMARSKAWNESGILDQMGHTPFTPDQIVQITSVSASQDVDGFDGQTTP